MIKDRLKVLVNVAKIDGELDQKELKLIHNIGEAHGLSDEEIENVITSPDKAVKLASLSDDDKFELLYRIVQLMKIDDEVYNKEILYCQQIADKLGYRLEAIMEIYPHVYKNVRIPDEIVDLKKRVKKLMKNKGKTS